MDTKDLSRGWICPVCNHGVRPELDRCPCADSDKNTQPQVVRFGNKQYRLAPIQEDYYFSDTTSITSPGES